jgi:hypothetical protein
MIHRSYDFFLKGSTMTDRSLSLRSLGHITSIIFEILALMVG